MVCARQNRQPFAIFRRWKAWPNVSSNPFNENYFRTFKGLRGVDRYDSCPYMEERARVGTP
jgi:hypothetical protein